MKCYHVSVPVENGDINKALKVFKKRCFQSGHIKDVKDNAYYIKPKTKRKLVKELAVRRQKMISDTEKVY